MSAGPAVLASALLAQLALCLLTWARRPVCMQQTWDDTLWHVRRLCAHLGQHTSASNDLSAHGKLLAEQQHMESGRNWSQPVLAVPWASNIDAIAAEDNGTWLYSLPSSILLNHFCFAWLYSFLGFKVIVP